MAATSLNDSYSNSIVAGGLMLISYATLDAPVCAAIFLPIYRSAASSIWTERASFAAALSTARMPTTYLVFGASFA